jgi:hypothetical protein
MAQFVAQNMRRMIQAILVAVLMGVTLVIGTAPASADDYQCNSSSARTPFLSMRHDQILYEGTVQCQLPRPTIIVYATLRLFRHDGDSFHEVGKRGPEQMKDFRVNEANTHTQRISMIQAPCVNGQYHTELKVSATDGHTGWSKVFNSAEVPLVC